MRDLSGNQLLWLFVLAAAINTVLIEAAMPDPVTEQACQTCELAVETLNRDRTTCENTILASQQSAGGTIAGFKTYFTDIEGQMKKLEPGMADLKKELDDKYKQEAKMYAELRKESRMTSAAFLNRHRSRTPAELLVDRWLKCDDDRSSAQVYLNGCKTKMKTVEMWDSQRVRMYKDKADNYIMRSSRQADPVNAQFEEKGRLTATIRRMEQQLPALKLENKELLCPTSCTFPSCAPGEPDNGGSALSTSTIWGSGVQGCTRYCSRPFNAEATRFCGDGSVYLDGAYVDCTRCL